MATVTAYAIDPASILESETIPSLDQILLDYRTRLTDSQCQDIRRVIDRLEEILYDLEHPQD